MRKAQDHAMTVTDEVTCDKVHAGVHPRVGVEARLLRRQTNSRTREVRGGIADQVNRLIRGFLSLGSKPFRFKFSRCC